VLVGKGGVQAQKKGRKHIISAKKKFLHHFFRGEEGLDMEGLLLQYSEGFKRGGRLRGHVLEGVLSIRIGKWHEPKNEKEEYC